MFAVDSQAVIQKTSSPEESKKRVIRFYEWGAEVFLQTCWISQYRKPNQRYSYVEIHPGFEVAESVACRSLHIAQCAYVLFTHFSVLQMLEELRKALTVCILYCHERACILSSSFLIRMLHEFFVVIRQKFLLRSVVFFFVFKIVYIFVLFAELGGPVGQIVVQDRGIAATEQGKILIPPSNTRYVSFGHKDLSIRVGLHESDRSVQVSLLFIIDLHLCSFFRKNLLSLRQLLQPTFYAFVCSVLKILHF